MSGEERELHQRLAARLQRALVVDPQAPAALAMSELLRALAGCQIWTAPDAGRGLELSEHIAPHLVLAARRPDFDGPEFLKRLRRSDFDSRQAPAIIYSPEATAAALLAARDAGAQEFLRLPVTRGELGRRLESAIVRPREWVEGVGYVGPDRRRFNCGDYSAVLRRRVEHATTSEAARIDQAIRIVRDALAEMDRDPHQALRAMRAQADVLRALAETHGELRIRAEALGRRLARASPRHLRVARIEPLVTPLLTYASSGAAARKAA
jgi:CheY-like chemotaxis protein